MRTWLAKAASEGRQFAQIFTRTVAATIAVLSFGSIAALAQPAHEVGGEASLKLPDLSQVSFLGIDGHKLAADRHSVLRLRPGLRPDHLHPPEESAGASLHARNLRTDLRDLQDLSGHPGQVPAAPVALHRRHHRALFRRAVSGSRQADRHHAAHHSAVQPGRNRRQLRRGVVRHSRQHLRQLPHRVRRPARQALSRSTTFRCKPA